MVLLVRGLRPYSVLYKVYNVRNTYDEKSKIVGFKMYNYKIFYILTRVILY
jgi:hypothetical protein